MRSSAPVLILVTVLFAVTTAPRAQTPEEALILPDATHRAQLRPDRLFEIHAALRLPLTPPPGVQQRAAVQGWKVTLSAKGWTPDRRPASVRYTLNVVRIRPLRENVYRILTEIPPWLPEALFDVAVTGPGFSGFTPAAAVRASEDESEPKIIDLTGGDGVENAVVLPATPKGGPRRQLRMILPASYPGISVTQDGRPLAPKAATVAALPFNGERLLIYDIAAPSSTGEGTTVRWRRSAEAPCAGSVSVSEPESGRTMDYRNLTFQSKMSPASVIWDYGDGRYGSGISVRHRWLLTNEARVTARSIDREGRICKAEATVNLNPLLRESGCACTHAGAPGYGGGSVAATFFFLFFAAFGE